MSVGHNYLTEHGFEVATAMGVECVTLLHELNPDVVVLDTNLLWGGADGVLAHPRVRNNTRMPVLLLTFKDAISPGGRSQIVPPVVSALEKPVTLENLLEAVWFAAGESPSGRRRERPTHDQ